MEGRRLPAVTFTDHLGKTVKASELAAPFVLYAYPKDDTPGCTKEACGIRDDWGAFRKAGLSVYGVSKDDAKSHQKFIAKFDLPFPLLTADEAGLTALGFWKEKSFMGRTYMGVSRETYLVGRDGKVLKHYAKVRPEEHSAEILADWAKMV